MYCSPLWTLAIVSWRHLVLLLLFHSGKYLITEGSVPLQEEASVTGSYKQHKGHYYLEVFYSIV